jgi:CRISPR-associated endonuclease/helicase Cas3
MRSIIQLAGRIRRHRPGTCVESNPNLYLLDTNVKSLEQSIGIATFCKPGFESKDFLLTSHSLSDLLTQEQIGVINAKPRIALREPLQPRDNLVDLEHACLQTLMQGDLDQSALAVPPWWRTRAHLTAELQRTQRFRNSQPEERFALLPDDDEQTVTFQREVDGCWTDANKRLITLDSVCGPRISFWGAPDYLTALSELAETQEMEFSDCAKKFGVLQLPKGSGETQASWQYHPALGFRRDKH